MFTVTPPTKRSASPSTTRPAKHARTSFSPTTVSDASLRNMIKRLSKDQLQTIVLQTAQFHPAAKASIHSLVSSMQIFEAKDFKREVGECMYQINDRCARLRPSQQFERAFEVCGAIEEAVRTIVAGVQALTRNENAGEGPISTTWLNGYKALIDVGNRVMECEHGELGKCLRNDGVLGCIAEGMKELLVDLGNSNDVVDIMQMGGLAQATEKLGRDVKAYSIDDFEPVVTMFWQIIDDKEAEEEEDDDEEGSETERSDY